MRKILVVVGGLAVALVAAIVLGLVLFAPEGRRLDVASREYAVHMLDTAMMNWDLSALKAESSDELLAAVPDQKLAWLLGTFSTRLGPIRAHGEPRGESHTSFVPFRRVVTADYLVPTTFEKAEGQVALRLILKGDRWKLLAVNVNSDALLR